MATTVASLKADVTLDARGLKKGADLTKREFASLQRTFRSLTSAEEKQTRQLELLEKAYKDGTISLKQFREAERRLDAQVKTTNRSMKVRRTLTGGRGGAGGLAMAGIGRAFAPVAGALTVGAGARGVSSLISYAAELGDTADLLDTTTQNLQAMHHAVRITGNTSEQFNTALQRQQRRLGQAIEGTGEAAKVLESLGLAAEDFVGKDATENFINLGTAIAQSGDRATQLKNAMGLWDTEGVGLLRTLDMGPEKLREFRERFGTVTQEIADDARKFQESMQTVKTTLQAEAFSTYEQIKNLPGPTGNEVSGFTALLAAFSPTSEWSRSFYPQRQRATLAEQGFIETSPAVQRGGQQGTGGFGTPFALDDWARVGEEQNNILRDIANNTKQIPEGREMFQVDEVTVNSEP